MSDTETTVVYVILAAVLLLNVGILAWAWVLAIRAEWAERMDQAERMDLDAGARPLIPFDADREIEPPPDAVTELDR
jgi:hypothetical protein